MQLQQIHYVLKVHECGSFSAAARELFITQPTLSQQVMALEKELGVTLFIRHPRGVYLTDAGEEFIFYARRILNEVSSMESSMGSYAAQSKGLVKIGVLWVFAYLGIADVLSGFRAAHPQIETSMKVNGSVMLLNMLQNRDVDAIFFISMEQGIQRSDLYAQKLMENDMVAVLPADNPLAGLEVIHYGDLGGQNVIMPSRDSTIYAPVLGHFQACGITPKVVAESAQTDVTMACVASGMGVAFISSSNAQVLKSEKVVLRPLRPTIKRTIYFATLRDTLVIPAVRMLADYVREYPFPLSGS